MTKSPDLQVPQAPSSPPRRGLSGFAFVLLLILLVINVLGLFVSPGGSSSVFRAGPSSTLTVEQLKDAALELEQKNVSAEAAALWEEYLREADLGAVESGNIRYRIGKNYQNAAAWDQAFAQYVRAEKLLGDSNPDLTHEIGLRRMECLRKMGQFADLSREIAERASDDSSADLAGRQIVAEVDGEKINVTEFDRLLSNEIESAVKSRMGLSAEEENALRKRAHEQFADPKARAVELQRIVASRVLAAEARKRALDKSPAFRERLTAVADGILSSTLLQEEIGKRATVTDEDVKRYYAANADRYADPPATFIAHILCRDETHARDVIERIHAGASFEDIAKAESADAATAKTMGIITEPVLAEGVSVPMFGSNQALHDALRESAAGDILPDPYENASGWHVLKVVSHRERTEKPFEEIADEVRRDTLAARQREVTEQYLRELFETYKVKLYPEAFGAGGHVKEAETAKP